MKLIVVVVVMAMVAVGCGSEAATKPSGPSAAASDASGQASSGPAAASAPAPASQESRCPNGSLEGCFDYAGMAAYLQTVRPLVTQFFAEKYPKLPAPRDVVFIPARRYISGVCGLSDSAAYEYCPADGRVFIGQDLLWSFYRRQGDAAPVVALAHEFGHHVQVMQRVPNPRSAAQSVVFENQADCIAGAFAQYADQKGWLEKDDLGDVEGLMQAVGSRESRYRDHGTVAERTLAFESGFKSGVKACNSYFPSTPVA